MPASGLMVVSVSSLGVSLDVSCRKYIKHVRRSLVSRTKTCLPKYYTGITSINTGGDQDMPAEVLSIAYWQDGDGESGLGIRHWQEGRSRRVVPRLYQLKAQQRREAQRIEQTRRIEYN